MRKMTASTMLLVFVWSGTLDAQQADVTALRAELAALKDRIAALETTLERLQRPAPTPAAAQSVAQPAPALNTPPVLPPSRAEAYEKAPPRFDVLVQMRATAFRDASRADTFSVRKAELGVKGHISANTDFSLELDPVRPTDPFRRTYIRVAPHRRLHFKVGLEKAPIGLDELTPTAQIPFIDRSEVSDRFSAAEELGVHVESRWDRWLVQLAVTNGGRRLLRDDNGHKTLTGRLVWAPRTWLSLGGATMQGATGPDEDPRDRYNVELRVGSMLSGFQSELFRARDADVWSSAYYAAAYWAVPVERGWLTHVQPVVRYEQIDRSDRRAPDELRLITSGVSLLFDRHRSKLQINFLKDVHTRGRKDELRAQYQVEF